MVLPGAVEPMTVLEKRTALPAAGAVNVAVFASELIVSTGAVDSSSVLATTSDHDLTPATLESATAMVSPATTFTPLRVGTAAPAPSATEHVGSGLSKDASFVGYGREWEQSPCARHIREICLFMRKILLSVSDPLDAWIRAEGAALGVSVSEFVRRILDAARARSEKTR